MGFEEARRRTILTARFFEHTKTRVSSEGHSEGGKLHNWPTCKANGESSKPGTEDAKAYNDGPH
jgi:hypothetical protein